MSYLSNTLPFELSGLTRYAAGNLSTVPATSSASKTNSRQAAYAEALPSFDNRYVKNGWEPIEDWRID